jgi:gluconokinase
LDRLWEKVAAVFLPLPTAADFIIEEFIDINGNVQIDYDAVMPSDPQQKLQNRSEGKNLQTLYCGIDIGTSSTKAMIYTESLQGIFSVAKEYDFVMIQQDRAELNPDEIYDAVITCLRAGQQQAIFMGMPLSFIAFSAALHSFIAMDAYDRPLTNCITWADMRAMEFNNVLRWYCKGLIYQKTGCPGNAIYIPAKILWLQKYQPVLFDRVAKYVSIKEYVLRQLSGEWIVDYGIASGSGLLHLKSLQWDNELLEELAITSTQLSTLVDGPTIIPMQRGAIEAIGADIPLVVGSGDGPLANLAVGAYSSQQFVTTIGSSGAIRVLVKKPILDSKQRTWCYRLDGQTYIAGAAINNGGIVLKWLIENYLQEEMFKAEQQKKSIYETLNRYALEVPVGSNGLFFLPFLSGERSPDWNSMARGLIIGLGISHSKKELVRAAMEGVVLRLYSNFLILQDLVGKPKEIVVNGGFTRSQVWLQITANVFGKKLLFFKNTVNSTLGAVLMGLKAFRLIEAYDQVNTRLHLKTVIRPDSKQSTEYVKIHRLYEKIYSYNKHIFKELQKLRENNFDQSVDHTKILL